LAKIKTRHHGEWFARRWILWKGIAIIECPVLRGRVTTRRTIATAIAVAALALPGAAFADSGGLIDQYIEDVPTSSGSHHAGAGGGSGSGSGGGGSTSSGGSSSAAATPAPLSSDVKTKIEASGGKDSKLLQDIATSPRYGAPTESSGAVPTPTGSPDPLSASVSAVTDGSDGRMVALFVALLVITAVSVGAAAARRRA
jgi:hypothetical protein